MFCLIVSAADTPPCASQLSNSGLTLRNTGLGPAIIERMQFMLNQRGGLEFTTTTGREDEIGQDFDDVVVRPALEVPAAALPMRVTVERLDDGTRTLRSGDSRQLVTCVADQPHIGMIRRQLTSHATARVWYRSIAGERFDSANPL